MLTETELIVLSGVRYSDSASIVTTYSEHLGTLSFKCIRSTSRRRGGANALFSPLSILHITFDYLPNRSIQTPRDQEIRHRPLRPAIDPYANAVALFTTELLTRLLRNTGADSDLYHYLRGEIVGMEQMSDRGINSFHLRLLVGLLLHLGILPNTERYRAGDILDITEGVFRSATLHEEPAHAYASSLFYQFVTTPEPQEIPLTREARNALLHLLLAYLNHHLPYMGSIKSAEILTQLF